MTRALTYEASILKQCSQLRPGPVLEQSLHIQDQPVQCSQETSNTQQGVTFVPKGLECFSVFLALCPINKPRFRFLTQDVSVLSETMYSTNSNMGKKPPLLLRKSYWMFCRLLLGSSAVMARPGAGNRGQWETEAV